MTVPDGPTDFSARSTGAPAPESASRPAVPAGQPVRRPGGRTAQVRRRVLDAVRVELVTRGYDGLTVDGVAERSGVHRTTVYRRWRDVGGMLADVLAEATADDWRPADTGSLLGDLLAVNRELYAALTADPPVTTALIAASFRSTRAAEALQIFWADRYARCAVLVHRAVRRAEVPSQTDPRRLLVAATAPLYHELVLLRVADPDGRLAARAALDAATAARAGAFTERNDPPDSSPEVGSAVRSGVDSATRHPYCPEKG